MVIGSTDKKLRYKLYAIAAPIIIQNLVHYIQLQVDIAMLGHSNTLFLSAVGNVLYPYNIVLSFLTALSTGATVLIAHGLGGRSLNGSRRYAEVSFFYNLVVSLPLFLLLFFFPDTLMSWMGATDLIKVYAVQFLRSLSFSILFLGIQLTFISIFQGVGKTRPIMIAAIIATIANVFFDWLLIYGNWGLPALGIQGAGMATSIANCLSMCYLIFAFFVSKALPFKSSMKGILNPRWSIHKRSFSLGLPYGMEAMFWSFGQIFIIRMINEKDSLAVGTYILISRIQSIALFFYLGFAKATMVLVGQEMGAGNKQMASHITYMSLRIAVLTAVVASSMFLLFPEYILLVFTTDKNLLQASVPLLNIVAVTVFPVTVNVVIGNAIRGLKDTRWMFYTQCLGTTFVILLSAILLFVFDLSLAGVFITILCDECIRGFLNFRHFRQLTR